LKRPSRRQRLRRDPCNQPWHKLVAWAKRNKQVEAVCTPTSLLKLIPRVIWKDRSPEAIRRTTSNSIDRRARYREFFKTERYDDGVTHSTMNRRIAKPLTPEGTE
jgi:hypothetical protein